MNVTGNLDVLMSLTSTEPLDLSTPRDTLTMSDRKAITNGTGADQANLVWHDQRTLASGANEELDLAGGLTDAYGGTVTFAKIKAILITNPDTASTLIIGGAAANGWTAMFADSTDKIVIRPGGRFYMEAADATGLAVTAGSGDLLKIEHGAESSVAIDYKIAIAGVAA